MSRNIIVMPMVLLMAPLHSGAQNDQNEVKYDFFSCYDAMVTITAIMQC